MTIQKLLQRFATAAVLSAVCAFGMGAPSLRVQAKQKPGASCCGAKKQSAASKKAAAKFAARAGELLGAMPTNKGAWGMLIVDGETSTTLFEQNADKYFVPASNMK